MTVPFSGLDPILTSPPSPPSPGSVKYVWPIQQPLSDFGAQRKRMDAIRAATGWQLIGCELLECYTFQ